MVTSMISGPVMQKILRLTRARKLSDFLPGKAFVGQLFGDTSAEAIGELSAAVSVATGLDARMVAERVVEREALGPTGLGDGVAVPHARLEALRTPVVAVGLSRNGVDFNAPDGNPANLIFLILTPHDDDGAQVEILADIARTFRHPDIRERAVGTRSFTEFLALLRTQPSYEN
jgi:mannitol/fructose-specific phosphotransferase system IIA component (Ntr-type)